MVVETRAETVILALLELVGFGVAGYGLYFQYSNISTIGSTGMAYCCIWYVLGLISHFLGLLAIWMDYQASLSDEDINESSQKILQYHYLTAWFSIVLGYPLMVNYTWLMYYPTWLAHFHLLLALVPGLTWLLQSSAGIVRTTQICTIIGACSHFFVCFLAKDVWGWGSAIVMVVNVVALSTPTKYHVWAFNSRELFVIGLVATSILMNWSIVGLTDPKKKIKSLNVLRK